MKTVTFSAYLYTLIVFQCSIFLIFVFDILDWVLERCSHPVDNSRYWMWISFRLRYMPFRCAFSYEIDGLFTSLDGLFTFCVSSRKWCLRHQWLVKWNYRQNSQLYNHQITFICAAYEIKFNKIKDGRRTSCILPWDGWQWKNIHSASTQSFTATSLYPSIASWIAISAISADIQLGWLYFGSFSFWDQKENPQKKNNWPSISELIRLPKSN